MDSPSCNEDLVVETSSTAASGRISGFLWESSYSLISISKGITSLSAAVVDVAVDGHSAQSSWLVDAFVCSAKVWKYRP